MQSFIAVLDFCNANAQAIKAIGSLGTLIVGVIAALTFHRKVRVESLRNEQAIFDNIDDRYQQLNVLAFENPGLDVSWFSDDHAKQLDRDQYLQQALYFEMLTRLFERVFLVFRAASQEQRARQWSGWESFIEDFCLKGSYRNWWNTREWPLRTDADGSLDQYDSAFLAFMENKMKTAADRRPVR